MSEIEELSARIETLEVRIAYQDETIETLNAVIAEQWKRIDDLQRQVARLDHRISETEDRAPAAPAEKPPHY